MRIHPIRPCRPLACVLLLFSGLAPSPAIAQDWTINHFKVYSGAHKATEFGEDVMAIMPGAADIPQAAREEIEKYLHEVAVKYDSLGFKQPVLEPRVTLEDSTRAYRVYLHDYPDSETPARYAVRSSDCSLPDKSFIEADSSRVIVGGKLTTAGMEHLGHELFHAVQMSYPLFQKHCHLGHWIVEGTAEAMGMDVLYTLKPGINHESLGDPVNRWSARRYYTPLRVEDDPGQPRRNDAYGTATLWRYIGEFVAQGGPPGATPRAPDYRYLARFFTHNLAAPASAKSELDWLDKEIEGELGLNLARVFGQFAPWFADYVPNPARMTFATPPGNAEKKAAAEKWHKWVFGECKVVNVVQGGAAAPLALDFEIGGARCVTVEAEPLGPVATGTLSIQTQAAMLNHILQLQIGALGGGLVSMAATPDESALVSPFPAAWEFPISFTNHNVFIITNLSPHAAGTDKVNLDFFFAIPSSSASLNKQAGSAGVSPANVAQPKTSGEVGALARAGLQNPGTRSGNSVRAGRNKPVIDPGCSPQDQADNRCGPQISIALMTAPEIIGNNDLTTSAGGALKQREGMGLGLSDIGDAQQMAQSQAQLQEMMSAAGNMISISVPLVPYGFTGDLTNARISVGMGRGKIGESVEQRGKGYRASFVPSGTLTIDEYSPLMLRGRFSGNLVDLASVTQGPGGSVQMPPPDTIRGEFVIPAPWKGDPAYRVEGEGDLDSPMMDQVRQDIIGMVMMMPEGMRHEWIIGKSGDAFCNMGFSELQLQSLKLFEACAEVKANTQAGGQAQCNCGCRYRDQEQLLPHCQQRCGEAWNSCPAAPGASTVASADELEALREAFRGFGYPEELVEQYVDTLQDAPPEARAALLEQLKPQL